jgi:prolyl 4-hydroxylase
MKTLADYIMIVDGVIPPEMCDTMIQVFEASEMGDAKRVTENEWGFDYRKFTELHVGATLPLAMVNEFLIKRQCEIYEEYAKRTGTKWLIPLKDVGFEGIRMKKYEANDHDQFGWHVDVGNFTSSKRELAMFTYLNDVEEGGETLFDIGLPDGQYLTIKPKLGRMVVFPPMWQFPHKGNKPVSGPKYIVSQYIHYL